LKSGANLILTTLGIDDLAQKYLIEAGVIGIRRVEKADMRKIARSSGAKIVTTMANTDGTEGFSADNLGDALEAYEDTVGDMDYFFITGMKNETCCTLLLRGPNDFALDEVERSIHDSICVIKRTLESGYVVPGGGCIEIALNIYLEAFARTLGTKEQISVAEFSEALTVIPKTLSINAALNANELVSNLKTIHYYSQNRDDEKGKELKYYGLDLFKGKCRNNLKAGVLEPAVSKIKCIRFATEAAITILRIDDMIKLT